MSFNLDAWMLKRQEALCGALDSVFKSLDTGSDRLKQAMRYNLNSGKFIRPLLFFATCEIYKKPYKKLLEPACALELIHAYSLIHDDLPAMDDDELRRGQPSCHIKFDEATAILAGDGLQTLAFDLLAKSQLSSTIKLELIKILTKAAGATGMVGGQALDMEFEKTVTSLGKLKKMYLMKTGALISAAIDMGLIAAEAYTQDNKKKFYQISQNLGLLFQIQDDILDASADTKILGKPAGSDAANEKATYVSILGLAGAKTEVSNLLAQLQNNLAQIDGETEVLAAIIEFIFKRKF